MWVLVHRAINLADSNPNSQKPLVLPDAPNASYVDVRLFPTVAEEAARTRGAQLILDEVFEARQLVDILLADVKLGRGVRLPLARKKLVKGEHHASQLQHREGMVRLG